MQLCSFATQHSGLAQSDYNIQTQPAINEFRQQAACHKQYAHSSQIGCRLKHGNIHSCDITLSHDYYAQSPAHGLTSYN